MTIGSREDQNGNILCYIPKLGLDQTDIHIQVTTGVGVLI